MTKKIVTMTIPFEKILDQRLARRRFVKGLGYVTLGGLTACKRPAALFEDASSALQKTTNRLQNEFQTLTKEPPVAFTFQEVPHLYEKTHRAPFGYNVQTLLRWGDRIIGPPEPFDPFRQLPQLQERQFGFNNDFIAFMPLPYGSQNSDHGLLCVNHEYTDAHMMFPNAEEEYPNDVLVQIEMAAHGHSVVEVKKQGGEWYVVHGKYNNKLSGLTGSFRLTGPAAGHKRMRTREDPKGLHVVGTYNNCAGGVTPWNTVLIAEENINGYFAGDPDKTPEARNHKAMGIKKVPRYPWNQFDLRFNIEDEPNEPNRFGWICEFDPYDPHSIPVKRTALGRFKHEGAEVALSHDGRVAVYSGDDEAFQYIYKYVSKGWFNKEKRAANRTLLDEGTLYVARFEADGTLRWLPLEYGKGPLVPANDFHSQADVLIETRRAARMLGATPMDRPEDIALNPENGHLYLVLTKNKHREQVDAANPRAKNKYGHILEIIPPGERQKDHTARSCRWEIFMLAGNPYDPSHDAYYKAMPSKHGWLTNPDNVACDNMGRLWITTDGQPKSMGAADGIYVAETAGENRGQTRHFFNAPKGAEVTGPAFTPDRTTLFFSIQHPGDDKGSSFENPSTRWPDFAAPMPPRPSVVAITREDGEAV